MEPSRWSLIQCRAQSVPESKPLRDGHLNINKGVYPLDWAMAGSSHLFDTSFHSDTIMLESA